MIVLFSLTNDVLGFFGSRTKFSTVEIHSKECCIQPKINVNSKKANLGKNFLRQLSIDSDIIYEKVNPENMCSLIHFLFQQASINKKSVIVNEEMFILFDSSNLVFNRIIQSKQHQQYETINVSIESDRYHTYGMDIPKSCLPNKYDHILFGELPPFLNDYDGKRIFIKPERFGFEKTRISSIINDAIPFIEQKGKQRFCRLIQGQTKSECAKIRAFKTNTDKIIFKNWIRILSKLSFKWKIDKQYKTRAIKYGIYEMDQQSRDLETIGVDKDVKNFRKLLIEKYGQDDLRKRQGQEIIFTITQLKQSHLTCESNNKIKQC